MIWKFASLMVFLAAFAKHGEASRKMMSIYGDINFAMFDTAIQSTDVIGFLYDDGLEGFSVNASDCFRSSSGSQAFSVQTDCTVQAGIGFTENPKKREYLVHRDPDFPEPNTGSNFVVAKREEGSPFERRVTTRSRVAVNVKNILRYPSKSDSEIYCNDKDHEAMKPLFDFDNEHKGRIIFRKNGRFYERKMKCVAVLRDSTHLLMAAKLFTLIISNAPDNQFKFAANQIQDGSLNYVPNSPHFYVKAINSTSESTLKTKYAFLPVSVDNCKARITIQKQDEEQPMVQFTYDTRTYNMPAILPAESLDCGIARIGTGTPAKMSFGYWCDCTSSQ